MPHKNKYTKTDLQIHKYKYTVEVRKLARQKKHTDPPWTAWP